MAITTADSKQAGSCVSGGPSSWLSIAAPAVGPLAEASLHGGGLSAGVFAVAPCDLLLKRAESKHSTEAGRPAGRPR
jgi:hypothetical protein